MKTKQNEKKFRLNKMSIASLSIESLRNVLGGEDCPPPVTLFCTFENGIMTEKPGDSHG